MVDLARRRGLTILGPNGNGYINAAAGITPYGLPIDKPLLSGPVGVVLQSGALASSVLTFAQSRNVGVSLLVSMGNESMVSMTDVMRYLIDDDATRVIALFIESVRRPDEFLALAREALAKGKPVVAIKVGRSQAGARVAARPHRLPGRRRRGGRRGVPAERGHPGRLPGGPHHHRRAAGRDRPAAGQPLRVHHRVGRRQRDHRRPGRGRGHRDPRVRAGDGGAAAQVVPTFAATQNPVDVTGYILINRDLMRNALAAVHDDPGLDALVLVSDLPRTAPPDPAPIIEMFRQSSELHCGTAPSRSS